MADFCRRCAHYYNNPLADLGIKELEIEENFEQWVLCEGCGMILLVNENGKEIVYRPDRTTYFFESENEPRKPESEENNF